MKSLQSSNHYTGNVKVRELNDGGPPKPCSTHNQKFTELKFDIHSPEIVYTVIPRSSEAQVRSSSKS